METERGPILGNMELQPTFPDGARLGAAINFTSGYASALVDQRNPADAPQLEKFEEHFRELIENCKERPEKPLGQIGDESPESVRSFSRFVALLIESLNLLISMRSSFLERNPEAKTFWTDEAQETLDDTVELFEDVAETLALGLDSAFHEEIDSARKEAGIDSNAKVALPTR